MLVLTERSLLKCAHQGMAVVGSTSQSFVRINGAKVAIGQDPSGKPVTVVPCPMTSPKPCTSTRRMQLGHSSLLFIEGTAVCLDSVFGITDFPAPYTKGPVGQDFVGTTS